MSTHCSLHVWFLNAHCRNHKNGQMENLITTDWRQIRLTNSNCYFQTSLILICAHKWLQQGNTQHFTLHLRALKNNVQSYCCNTIINTYLTRRSIPLNIFWLWLEIWSLLFDRVSGRNGYVFSSSLIHGFIVFGRCQRFGRGEMFIFKINMDYWKKKPWNENKLFCFTNKKE